MAYDVQRLQLCQKRGWLQTCTIVKTGEKRAIAEMKQACKAALSEHSVPARYIILDALPYTSAGKVDFRSLERKAVRKENL